MSFPSSYEGTQGSSNSKVICKLQQKEKKIGEVAICKTSQFDKMLFIKKTCDILMINCGFGVRLPDGDEEAEDEHGDASRPALSWVVRYLL